MVRWHQRPPVRRVVFVPTDNLTIQENWHSSGLQATGSHHVRADDVAVDLRHSTTSGGSPWLNGPLWQVPLFTVLLPVLVTAPLGMARAADDTVQQRVAHSGSGAMRGELADDPVGVAEPTAADASLRAAYAGVLAAVGDAWTAGDPRSASFPCRSGPLHDVGAARDRCRVESISTSHRLCGGAAALLTSLLDVHIAHQQSSRRGCVGDRRVAELGACGLAPGHDGDATSAPPSRAQRSSNQCWTGWTVRPRQPGWRPATRTTLGSTPASGFASPPNSTTCHTTHQRPGSWTARLNPSPPRGHVAPRSRATCTADPHLATSSPEGVSGGRVSACTDRVNASATPANLRFASVQDPDGHLVRRGGRRRWRRRLAARCKRPRHYHPPGRSRLGPVVVAIAAAGTDL